MKQTVVGHKTKHRKWNNSGWSHNETQMNTHRTFDCVSIGNRFHICCWSSFNNIRPLMVWRPNSNFALVKNKKAVALVVVGIGVKNTQQEQQEKNVVVLGNLFIVRSLLQVAQRVQRVIRISQSNPNRCLFIDRGIKLHNKCIDCNKEDTALPGDRPFAQWMPKCLCFQMRQFR